VIATISDIAAVCKKKEKPMVICGEAAANPKCAYLYLGMGINQLSMNAPSVPVIKHLIRNAEQKQAKEILTQVLSLDEADEIENFVDNSISPLLRGMVDE
jgi:phosphoenolpyruvate-protein kinase (PTS system EI component)